MTLRHLEVFIAVVDSDCSVTRAAEKLNTVQPAVSRTISDLEQYYGLKFFDRLNRKLYLNEAGRIMLFHARSLIESFELMEVAISEKSGNLPLRVGASVTVGTVLLPNLLQLLKNQMKYTASVMNTTALSKALLQNELDIAIVEGDPDSRDLVEMKLIEDELIAVRSPAFMLDQEDFVWILREKGSASRLSAEQHFPINKKNIWSVANTQSIIELVRAGQGVTVISHLLIQQFLRDKTLVKIDTLQSVTRAYRIVYHKDRVGDPQIEQFIYDAREYCRTLSFADV